MGVDVPDAKPMQPMIRDEVQDFIMLGDGHDWERAQLVQNSIAVTETSDRDFADHPRMCEHLPCFQQTL
jgi:hypothetical protein